MQREHCSTAAACCLPHVLLPMPPNLASGTAANSLRFRCGWLWDLPLPPPPCGFPPLGGPLPRCFMLAGEVEGLQQPSNEEGRGSLVAATAAAERWPLQWQHRRVTGGIVHGHLQ